MKITIKPIVYKLIACSVLIGVGAGLFSGVVSGLVYGEYIGFISGAVFCSLITLSTFNYIVFKLGEKKCFKIEGANNG
jgi:tetrahydromethanopterin S-methyltransferase subunit F